MSAVKLYKINGLENGTQRFQSQMLIGTDTANFIMRTDNVMRHWRNGEYGLDFYEYKEPYVIVDSIEEMNTQEL